MGNRCFVPLEGGEIEIIHVPTPGCVVQTAFTALNAADQFSEIKIMSHMWKV